nr:ERCC4 domain-containing protein [Methanobrevibacter arboriphilus]
MSNIKNKLEGKIYIDSRERERIVSAQKYFGHDNTEIKQLDVGDYIYKPNDSDKCCVCEVKQVHTDLFSSIESRTLFRQVADMVREFPIHYLLIVGNPEEEIIRNTIIKKKNPNYYWNFTLDQWDGFYSSVCQVTSVVFAYNWERGLKTMNLLFKKSTDNKNRIYNYMDKYDNQAATYMACKKGVGQKTAELITNELELETLKDLLSLEKDTLLSVKGIGEQKAELIMKGIGV